MMSLITADFSFLPDVRIPGERAPLVASKVHQSVLLYDEFLCLTLFFHAISAFCLLLDLGDRNAFYSPHGVLLLERITKPNPNVFHLVD